MPGPGRPPLATFLGDLIVVTEPFALIPPKRRASVLEDLAFTTPSSPGVEGAVAAWAAIARGILDDRYRVSGWALQTVAADLALIALEVRRQFVVGVGGSIVAVGGGVSVSDPIIVLAKGDVENPVELVLYGPMVADGRGKALDVVG